MICDACSHGALSPCRTGYDAPTERDDYKANFHMVLKNRVEREHEVERWSRMSEKGYVLGTHDEELVRLGLQHRVWRPVALACWQRAAVTVGKRVLDVGAGPGYATVDLAEIVGPTGEVVAVERSRNFIHAMEAVCRDRSLTNVRIHELDLMQDELPKGDY